MSKVDMNNEQFTINPSEPQLPRAAQEASRNHGGMTVPEGFFAQFEQKMNAVIDAEVMASQPVIGPKEAKTVSLTRRWAGIAAAVLALVMITAAFQINWTAPETIAEPELVAETEVIDYEDQTAEEIYYAQLSDYEVYDLICGI